MDEQILYSRYIKLNSRWSDWSGTAISLFALLLFVFICLIYPLYMTVIEKNFAYFCGFLFFLPICLVCADTPIKSAIAIFLTRRAIKENPHSYLVVRSVREESIFAYRLQSGFQSLLHFATLSPDATILQDGQFKLKWIKQIEFRERLDLSEKEYPWAQFTFQGKIIFRDALRTRNLLMFFDLKKQQETEFFDKIKQLCYENKIALIIKGKWVLDFRRQSEMYS